MKPKVYKRQIQFYLLPFLFEFCSAVTFPFGDFSFSSISISSNFRLAIFFFSKVWNIFLFKVVPRKRVQISCRLFPPKLLYNFVRSTTPNFRTIFYHKIKRIKQTINCTEIVPSFHKIHMQKRNFNEIKNKQQNTPAIIKPTISSVYQLPRNNSHWHNELFKLHTKLLTAQ